MRYREELVANVVLLLILFLSASVVIMFLGMLTGSELLLDAGIAGTLMYVAAMCIAGLLLLARAERL